MTPHTWIKCKHRLISAAPWLCRISGTYHLIKAGRKWSREGWTAPPPYFVRRAMIRREARGINAGIFVESGTFLGDTTWEMMSEFRKIHTIEVEPKLAALARERFERKASVSVVEGDSAKHLPDICASLDGPCLFYLDGHYSGGITGMGEKECPLVEELHAIFSHSIHPFVIIIDDARLIGTNPFYPRMDTIRRIISGYAGNHSLEVENDAILIR